MKIYDTIKEIKEKFFAHRNGTVADVLRRGGDLHSMIMGCQLVDVNAIARGFEPSAQLAQRLWSERHYRECRMVAPMLYPAREFNMRQALEWCLDVENNEIADILCFRLLCRLDYAQGLYSKLLEYDSPQVRYTAFRLLLNIILIGNVELNDRLKVQVEHEFQVAPNDLKPVLASILEEI